MVGIRSIARFGPTRCEPGACDYTTPSGREPIPSNAVDLLCGCSTLSCPRKVPTC